MNGLEGNAFIVAGGATGIGAATARRLAEEGANVVIGDINIARARQTASVLSGVGGEVFAVEFDLASDASVDRLVAHSIERFGTVAGLYNVGADLSAKNLGQDLDILAVDLAVWERTLDVNLLGYVRTIRAILPHFLETGRGAIVNTSSGAAFAGEDARAAYAASKAGVNALTRHVARTWGKQGVRCNAVTPGMVMGETQTAQNDDTLQNTLLAMTSLGRLGEPADLANTVAFLLSAESSWISGQVWNIDGGMTFRD
ncbi:SDR family NAD(P)-dependent oxidoreductase [Streptomyces sp. NPDC057245]|uniref:SDR family NAD(P)-dependent oxidoreductase n=1 Tax=Streptomyces TaxID=1883 RepID=UPI001C1E0118|nr:SDR family oxidoreductase [Streptomyces sp. A108]MBU6536714.1 SDR family oxidoreductase [Streptomyces sp. A108]